MVMCVVIKLQECSASLKREGKRRKRRRKKEKWKRKGRSAEGNASNQSNKIFGAKNQGEMYIFVSEAFAFCSSL